MSERRFEITEDMMRKAAAYLPMTQKEWIVRAALPGCVKRIFDFDYGKGEYLTEADDLPTSMPMYGEDTGYKSQIMLGVVLHYYLGIDIGENLNLSREDYDRYAESHVLNQIERYKANAEFKSKAFDMLADIRDVEKRLNCAIYSMLQMKNDVGDRLMRALGTMLGADALETVMNAAKDAQAGIAAEREKQDAFIEGLETGEGGANA